MLLQDYSPMLVMQVNIKLSFSLHSTQLYESLSFYHRS